jgi:hypothetical protein
MKILLISLATLLGAVAAAAQNIIPPEVVRLENVKVDSEMRTVYVGNANKHYVLFCNAKAVGCITPQANKNYLLFNAKTRWKITGGTDFIMLTFVQDLTTKYDQGENIGLVAEDAKGDLGMFILDRTGGGYEQDTIFSDGPIIYGTGMNDEDRRVAWKRFFIMMVKAVTEQQGQDALGAKLARRCLPNHDFCTMALDAMLVGVGGIREPRRVSVIVATDVHDQNKQIERMVCTWPAMGAQVCREWDTGKLVTGDMTEVPN